MTTVKGILSFNDLFTPKAPTTGADPKFQAVLLFPPGDPQILTINAEFEAAKLESFPSGLPHGSKSCWNLYEVRYAGKAYFDPRMTGYMVLSTTAKADDRPHIVDANYHKIINVGDEGVQSGMLVHLNYGMSGYDKEVQQGIGGWLNGIMTTGVMGPLGSLSNKPTADVMFAGVNTPGGVPAGEPVGEPAGMPATVGATPPPATVGATPPPDTVGATPPPPTEPIMTAEAQSTYAEYIAAGWKNEQLVAKGYMIQPSFTG